MGESNDSGRNPGSDSEAKLAIISADPEQISAREQMASQIRDQG